MAENSSSTTTYPSSMSALCPLRLSQPQNGAIDMTIVPKLSRAKFPYQLHQLLEDAETNGFQECVSWLPDGKCFKIYDRKAFSDSIQVKYFRSKVYKSFQRNLNIWSFTRDLDGSIRHPHFRRHRLDLCLKMSRFGGEPKLTMENLLALKSVSNDPTGTAGLPTPLSGRPTSNSLLLPQGLQEKKESPCVSSRAEELQVKNDKTEETREATSPPMASSRNSMLGSTFLPTSMPQNDVLSTILGAGSPSPAVPCVPQNLFGAMLAQINAPPQQGPSSSSSSPPIQRQSQDSVNPVATPPTATLLHVPGSSFEPSNLYGCNGGFSSIDIQLLGSLFAEYVKQVFRMSTELQLRQQQQQIAQTQLGLTLWLYQQQQRQTDQGKESETPNEKKAPGEGP